MHPNQRLPLQVHHLCESSKHWLDLVVCYRTW